VTIGTSLFLIAVGAILKFAVTEHVRGVDIHAVGVILMVVGGIGLAVGLFLLSRARAAVAPPPPPPPPL
jgi:sulfite exporter TauE/SafE